MKKLISLKLALIFFFTAVSSLGPASVAYAQSKSCENGECIEKLIDKLEDLGAVYSKQCLPSQGSKANLSKYHVENGITEECWKIITEINHLESELQKHQNALEQRLGCESGDCKLPGAESSLNSQIASLTKVEQNLSCTEPKKQAIRNQCPADLNCALISTAMGVGGYLAEMIVPANAKPKGCNLGDDSCATQLATGFLKAAMSFFESAWDLLKMAGKAAGKKMGQFWNWVKGGENHSSTTQLAMAKASEDPGVFDQLMKDFPGTMKKIWAAFVGSLKEWMKTDIFCQKWSGVPHFSKCVTPTDSFDCLPCKTMVNGMCAITGTLVAEIVPSFLTGGLTTAAKYGAQGAVKIAKMFKVSSKGLKAVKASRVGKLAVQASTKVDDVLKLSKGVKAAKVAVDVALKAIRRYLLSPSRKVLKESYLVLSTAAKKGGLAVMKTPAGKVLIFTGKTVKLTAKAVIYPIDNPMTAFAYKAGQRSFDKLFKLGAPKLAATSAVASTLVKAEGVGESLLVKVQEAKVVKAKSGDLLKLEQELLAKVEPQRRALLQEALDKGEVELDDVIGHLYPELQYGPLAKSLPKEKVLAAEKELFLEIQAMPEGAAKTALTKKYQRHVVQGEARAKIVGNDSPTYKQIIDNSQLGDKERFAEAMKLLKRKPVDAEEAKKLQKALQEAHLVAPENGVFEYSWRELREKYRILTEGGFSKDEADLLLRSGLAGRPPVRELIKPGDTLFSGFAEDIVDARFLEKRDELYQLIKKQNPEKQKNFWDKVVGVFKGNTPEEAVKIQDNIESLYFIDYNHAALELEEVMLNGKKVSSLTISDKYNANAFNNFKNARTWLLNDKPELTKETLFEIHKRMMAGGIADFGNADDLGKIRRLELVGNVPYNKPISAAIKKEIQNNPYLHWVESGSTGDNFYGQIHYPNASAVQPKTLDLIRKSHPDLVKDLEDLSGLQAKITEATAAQAKLEIGGPDFMKMEASIEAMKARHAALTAEKVKLNEKLVDALLDDLMGRFNTQRAKLGALDSPEKLDQYANLLAEYQRDMISIHPLMDGNGRTTREFALSYALMKEGFPPPRIMDPNADIYTSLDDWKRMIKHGMLASDFLMDDLVERVKFGLPIENSTDLISPYTRPPVKMTLKGEKKVPFMEGVEYIDPRLYREIVKRLVKADPALQSKMTTNPLEAWDEIHKKAEQVFAKNNIYYKHPKKGIERVEVGYVDDDFKLLYGKASFDNKELFDFKMKTWYSEDVTWRGLASKHAEKSEDEIIEMFSEMTSHNASNAVLRKIGGSSDPEVIRKAAIEDFEKYNNDVFGDGLVAMAKDHSETGPMYGISYGYSTSKNREVGKAFAMGAMVVGEYGAHKAPELQALLKSRVLVGAKRARKDVDLGRLKQTHDEFSYKYGRQQEVMGIGASDPDAITIVQTIDAKGEVMLSYLRNKNNPKEIYVVQGDIDPDAVPTANQIVKTIKLGK